MSQQIHSEQQNLFAEVSRASHSAQPEVKKENQTLVISGLKCCELSRHTGLLGLLVKMLLESSIWHSTRCVLIWKTKDTASNRLLFQLAASTPRTNGSGSGFLLTPTATQIMPTEERYEKRKAYRASVGRKWVAGCLAEQLAQMYPTPTARDYKGARSSEALAASGRSQNNSLPDRFSQPGKTSQLNPRFVEEMMGYPIGWTELDR